MSFGYRNSLHRMKNNSEVNGSLDVPVDYSSSDTRNLDYSFMSKGIFNSYRAEDNHDNYLSQYKELSESISGKNILEAKTEDLTENGDFSVETVKQILDGYCIGVLSVEEIHQMFCHIIQDKNRKQLSIDTIINNLKACNMNNGVESLSNLKSVVNSSDSVTKFDMSVGANINKHNNAESNYENSSRDYSKVNVNEYKEDMQPSLQGWQMMHDAATTGLGNYNKFVSGECNTNSNNVCSSTTKNKNFVGHKDLMNNARLGSVLNNFNKIQSKGNISQSKKGQLSCSLNRTKSRYLLNGETANAIDNIDEKPRNSNFHFDNYADINSRLGSAHAHHMSCMSSPDFCCSRVSYSGTASPVDSNRLYSYDGYSNTDSPAETCDIGNVGWNNVFDFNSANLGHGSGKAQQFYGSGFPEYHTRNNADSHASEQSSPMRRHLFSNMHLGNNGIDPIDSFSYKSKHAGKTDNGISNLEEKSHMLSKFDIRNNAFESSKHRKNSNCNIESNMLYALLSNVVRENNDNMCVMQNSKKSSRGKVKSSSSNREFRSPFQLDKISDNLNLNYASQFHNYNRLNNERNYSFNSFASPVLSDRNQSPDSAVYSKCDFASPISNDTSNSWCGKGQQNEKFHSSANYDGRKTCCPGNVEYGGPYTRCLSFLRGSVGKVRWLRTTLTYLDECDPPFRTSADGKYTLYPAMASVDDIAVEAASKTFDLSESAYWSELEDGPYTHKSVRAVTAHKVGHRPVKNQRPYVDQILTADLDHSVSLLLHSLRAMDDRLKWLPVDRVPESCPRRVFTVGIREASRGMRHRKLKVLIVAPDIEETKRDGGLDDRVNQILAQAREYNTPVIFALCRHRIGKAIGKHMRMSMLGLMTTKGSQSMFDTVMYRVNMLRQLYQCFTKFYAPPNEATLKSLVGFIPRVMSLINDEIEDE